MAATPERIARAGIWISVAFVVLTASVWFGWTQPIDDAWKTTMVGAEELWLARVGQVFAFVGAFPMPLITIVFGSGALWLLRQPWAAGTWVAVVGIAQVLSVVIKALIDRARPLGGLAYEPSASYPSGHSMVSGAAMAIGLALVIGTVWPQRRQLSFWLAIAYTTLMALSRTYLRVHWLTDVVGGVLLGTAVALVVVGVAMHRRDSHRTPTANTHQAFDSR